MRQEAQAIVMAAGPGSRMTSVGFRAKCLLPVGHYPMLFYPLKFLQESGFDEATVIVNQKDEGEIKKLSEMYSLKMRLEVVPIDTSEDPGTVDSLRLIECKIKKNINEVVIISSDLITDASLLNMMNYHISRGAAVTALTANQNADYTKAAPPGPKSKTNISNDLLLMDEGTNRMLYSVAGGDYDDVFYIHKKMQSLAKGDATFFSNVVDGHLYIMKRWVVDYILHKESPCSLMSSLKAEVIPHLIAKQFSKDKANTSNKSIQKFVKKGKYEDLIKKYNTSIVESRFRGDSDLGGNVCYAFHYPGFCVRVNTMGTLWNINRKVNRLYDVLRLGDRKYIKGETEGINERAQICDQTLIGRSAQIAEKTNITNCVLGNHCRINSFVRLSNSVLFDYVQIEEGCIIENSLICVNVEKKCVIKNCVVADVSKICENKTYENELLERGLSQDFTY